MSSDIECYIEEDEEEEEEEEEDVKSKSAPTKQLSYIISALREDSNYFFKNREMIEASMELYKKETDNVVTLYINVLTILKNKEEHKEIFIEFFKRLINLISGFVSIKPNLQSFIKDFALNDHALQKYYLSELDKILEQRSSSDSVMFLRYTSKFNKLEDEIKKVMEEHPYYDKSEALTKKVNNIEDQLKSYEREISFVKDENKKLSNEVAYRLHFNRLAIMVYTRSQISDLVRCFKVVASFYRESTGREDIAELYEHKVGYYTPSFKYIYVLYMFTISDGRKTRIPDKDKDKNAVTIFYMIGLLESAIKLGLQPLVSQASIMLDFLKMIYNCKNKGTYTMYASENQRDLGSVLNSLVMLRNHYARRELTEYRKVNSELIKLGTIFNMYLGEVEKSLVTEMTFSTVGTATCIRIQDVLSVMYRGNKYPKQYADEVTEILSTGILSGVLPGRIDYIENSYHMIKQSSSENTRLIRRIINATEKYLDKSACSW